MIRLKYALVVLVADSRLKRAVESACPRLPPRRCESGRRLKRCDQRRNIRYKIVTERLVKKQDTKSSAFEQPENSPYYSPVP